jgi:hypothetical protein
MAMLYLGEKPFTLPDGGELTLGRHRDCGIQIADGKSSRRHTRVFHRDGGWWVEDLASANGTKLNGRAVITGPVQLKDGDVIGIGEAKVRFQLAQDKTAKTRRPPPAPTDDVGLVGRTFSGNRLDHFVGRGLTGPVFKAWCEQRRRNIMVKVLDKRLTADPEFAARFQRDLTIAAGIDDPAVVRIYQCAITEGRMWYSMELVEGESLATRMQEPLQRRDALDLALALGKALMAYHETGLVHGDVKPASVAFDEKRTLRLLDIGLIGLTSDEGRLLQAEGSTRQVFYLCPVQARGGQCNIRSDVYSLGCLLFQLLAGRPPFIGNSFEEVVKAHEREPVPCISAALNLPAQIDDVLSGMLHKDPFFRFEGMRFVLTELERVREQVP